MVRGWGKIDFGLVATVGLAALAAVVPAVAAARPGDIYVADNDGRVLRVKRETGAVSIVASGAPLVNPSGIAFDPLTEKLLVSDEGADSIFLVNRKTGAVSPAAPAGSPIAYPFGIARGAGGKIVFADADAGSGLTGALLRISGGSATVIDSGAPFGVDTYGLALAPSGLALMADDATGVLRRTAAGATSVLASDPPLEDATGLARAPDGTLYVADYGFGGIIRIKPNGNVLALTAPGAIGEPFDADLLPSGDLAVPDSTTGAVYRVNRLSGAVSPITATGIGDAYGVAVEPTLCGGRFATLSGTNAADSFSGSRFGDRIAGLKGGDGLAGLRGADTLCGAQGGDALRGGKGRDRLIGGPGDDVCVGGPGRDRFSGCEVRR